MTFPYSNMCMYSALHENILEMQLSDPQTYIIKNSGLESTIYILKAMQHLADMSKITHCLGIQTFFFWDGSSSDYGNLY